MTQDRPATSGDVIQCSISESFQQWMSRAGGSLVVTTYQAGKVAMIGWDGRQVTMLMRHFDKPMGMAISGQKMALATRNDVVLLANARLLAPDYLENQHGRYDALYLPRVSFHTGDINVHDMAYGDDGLWVVNTRFCCLSRLTDEHNFAPVWKPPFLSQIVPEDHCHLNGLTMVDGKPKYVTCLGETDVVGGWRPGKATGGCVIDVPSNQVIARGFAMPHSPRWYQGKLYLLHSGAGELIVIDPKTGKSTTVCALPAYLRGLGFVGDFALIGMCQIREKHIFGGLPVQQKHQRLLCGIAIIDLRTGKQVAIFEFTSGCQELFEVQFLPGVFKPMILNLEREAARQAFTAPQFSYWLRPSNEIKDPPNA